MTDLLYMHENRNPNNEVIRKRLTILHYGIPSIVIDKACDNFNWTRDKSMQVQTEYLRFLYLREVAQERLWIPEQIFGFWKTHRKIGHDYRTRFAQLFDNKTPEKLERPIQDIEKAYMQTIRLYEQYFGEKPSPEIWSMSAGLYDTEDKSRKLVTQYRYFTFALGLLLALKTANQSNNVIMLVFIGLFVIYLSLMRL